jgi:hypothetical protein
MSLRYDFYENPASGDSDHTVETLKRKKAFQPLFGD